MASIESEILKALTAAIDSHMKATVTTPYSGDEQSIAYMVGLRQGTYRGLTMALEKINGVLEDTAKKDDLL